MKYIVNAREMKNCDLNTIEKVGMNSEVLMERAALSVVAEIEKHGLLSGKIMIFCGFGNNGGDGLAIARLLYLKNYEVEVVCVGDSSKATKEVLHQLQLLQLQCLPNHQTLLLCLLQLLKLQLFLLFEV